MLTKIGVAALLGTIGTAAVGGTASAQEWRRPEPMPVTVAAPEPMPVAYGYGYGMPGVYYRHDRRDDFQRMQRERRERAWRHGEWLRDHGGWGYGHGDDHGFRR